MKGARHNVPCEMQSSQPIDVSPRVVMAGASGSGKTSLISQYINQEFSPSVMSSVGIDFRCKTLLLTSGKRAKAQLWDTAGQERFRVIAANYWRGADGIVYVFDMADMQGFLQVERWAEEATKSAKPGTTGVLLGNKSDLGYRRTVTREQAEQLASRLGLRYFEVSAKTGLNVSEAFRDAIEQAANFKIMRETQEAQLRQEQQRKVPVGEEGEKEAAGCCAVM